MIRQKTKRSIESSLKMSAKKKCVEKDQQTSDVDDKDPKAVINSLDYDALAKIIMLLPIPERIDMEEVCTKWKEACQLAWYDIKKYKCESSIGRCYDNRLLTQSYLEKILLRCGKYLKELSLSNVCKSSIMPFVGDHCKNLTSLECQFDDNLLTHNAGHFVQAFTQLDKLKRIKIALSHRCSDEMETHRINLSAIINSLPEEINGIHLFFFNYWCEKKQYISNTLKKFKKLQTLTLNSLCVDDMVLQEIAEKTTLVHLKIEITDKQLGFLLFDKLVNLEYIKIVIQGTSSIDDYADKEKNVSKKVLNTIFCTCKNLKHLDIPHDYFDVTSIPLKKWKNLQNLEYLCLPCDELSPDLANTIVKYCKNLKYLDLSLGLLNENAVTKLTELENLESLITSFDYLKLSERAIIAISNNCKKLKRLEIPFCTIVSSIDGKPLSSSSVLDELSKLQYLKHLNLFYAENLEDSTITAIANNCKNLKSLNIHGSSCNMTETALVPLTSMKNLQILKVGFHEISDSFIIRLRGLKELDCSYCDELTDAGIIQFIKNNPDLEKITLIGIDNLTSELVIAADHATKNRTNGIILNIKTSDQLIFNASKSIKSQWLVVEQD